jgi:hypothetical protein
MSPPKGVHTNESDIITDCNHQFCKSCIDNWINRNNKNSCPYCRNHVSQEKLFGIIYNNITIKIKKKKKKKKKKKLSG